MCLYNKFIKNPKYRPNKKNGGVIPAVTDDRVMWVPIGCGECIECRRKKAREMQARLLEDIKHHKNGKFITLTFSNEKYAEHAEHCNTLEGYDLDNRIATRAVHYFRERWRKEFKKSPRHWLITEIGGNNYENIHLHGIIWTNESKATIEKHWQNGFIWQGDYLNQRTVNYIIKYVNKTDIKHPNYKSIILTSPGIGAEYTRQKKGNWQNNKFKGEDTDETYRSRTGHRMAMPIYWRNKIYSEEEREKLWLQKLDKQERYVLGQKVDVSKTEKHYEQLLKQAQEKNIRLGYGTGEKDYEKEQYERDRRILMQKTRIQAAINREKGN